jgi:nitrogen fixation-related uncharacterized protein
MGFTELLENILLIIQIVISLGLVGLAIYFWNEYR